MKRIISLILFAVLCVLPFASCGEKDYNIDKAALAKALVDGGCFQDSMMEVPSQILKYSYEVSEDVSAVLYRGTNATAEELTVLEAPDAEGAKAVLDSASAYLDTLAATYDKYNAAEAARIRNAIIIRRGRFVIACVCNDKAAAEKIIDQYCK